MSSDGAPRAYVLGARNEPFLGGREESPRLKSGIKLLKHQAYVRKAWGFILWSMINGHVRGMVIFVSYDHCE